MAAPAETPAGAAPAAEAPCCGNCGFYRQRHADPALLAKAEAAGHVFPQGICDRLPTAAVRRPNEVCGEHPLRAAERERRFAERIGAAVSAALARGELG